MIEKDEPEKTKLPRRKKCYKCSVRKYIEYHYKSPRLNDRQIYICSEECWKEYLDMLSGWYV